ncbi:unnamed protein product, partial [Musa acuminata var. zebrina]
GEGERDRTSAGKLHVLLSCRSRGSCTARAEEFIAATQRVTAEATPLPSPRDPTVGWRQRRRWESRSQRRRRRWGRSNALVDASLRVEDNISLRPTNF